MSNAALNAAPMPTGGIGFLTALGARRRMIGALILRETRTRFGRSRMGYFWAVFEPVMHVSAMCFVYWAINRQAPVGASVIMFFATGVLPFFLFHKTALHIGAAVRGSQKVLRLPFVAPTDMVVARMVLEWLTWVAVVAVLFMGFLALGLAEMPQHPDVCAVAALTTLALGTGVGLINATAMTLWNSWIHIYATVTRPLYIFSAIFFSIDKVPSGLQEWLSWNPVLHAIQWFRTGFRADYASPIFDLNYLLCWMLGTLLIGLCMMRLARPRLAYA